MAQTKPINQIEDAIDKLDLDEPTIAVAPISQTADVIKRSTGDWKTDQRKFYRVENPNDPKRPFLYPYCAHWNVPSYDDSSGTPLEVEPGWWEGPSDAFVWLGQPFYGYPYTNRVLDPITNKYITVQTFLDPKKYATEIGGIPVKWIAWDQDTGCSVYRRMDEPTARRDAELELEKVTE